MKNGRKGVESYIYMLIYVRIYCCCGGGGGGGCGGGGGGGAEL